MGIGHSYKHTNRGKLFRKLKKLGFYFPCLIANNSDVSNTATLGMGCQIMNRSYIGPKCILKEDVIVNTGAIIEHECEVYDHAHLAPASCLCGNVIIYENVFIGAGGIVVQGMRVPNNFFLNAGKVFNNSNSFMEI